MFYIKRNDNQLGPYTGEQVKLFYSRGDLLSKDQIRHEKTQEFISVDHFLKFNNIFLVQRKESILDVFSNLTKVFSIVLNPFQYLKEGVKENSIILVLLGIVLTPAIALVFSEIPFLTYTIYGVYFALIWGLIIHKTIATDQVKLSTSLLIGLGTIAFSSIVILMLHLSFIGELINNAIESRNFILRAFAMFFGVAIIEEICKQFFVFITISKSNAIVKTRTAIYYGMIAGLCFGIFEGIEYQMTVNKEFEIDQNYFLNILRLTSLPFFHAMWAGIGSYFLALSFINLKYRFSFKILAILVPSVLHTSYNIFGFSILGIATIVLSSVLLTVYLTKSDSIGKNLINN